MPNLRRNLIAGLVIAVAGQAAADAACDSNAQMFVEAVPGLAESTGIASGTDLHASDSRLLLVSSVFVFSSCMLSTPEDCSGAPALSRDDWLNNLLLSGLLMDCYLADAEGYGGEQLTAWNQVEERAPADLRHRLMAQAAAELDIAFEVIE